MHLLIIPLLLLEQKSKAKTTKIDGFLQFREDLNSLYSVWIYSIANSGKGPTTRLSQNNHEHQICLEKISQKKTVEVET